MGYRIKSFDYDIKNSHKRVCPHHVEPIGRLGVESSVISYGSQTFIIKSHPEKCDKA